MSVTKKCSDNNEEDLRVLLAVNKRYKTALNYNIYCLEDRKLEYNNQITKKVAMKATILYMKKKSSTFHLSDAISIIGFWTLSNSHSRVMEVRKAH